MNVHQALAAVEHADTIVSGCEGIEELDEASDYHTAINDCPAEFTQEQKELAQNIILRAFERSIGRA
jgi:hypothetical protein